MEAKIKELLAEKEAEHKALVLAALARQEKLLRQEATETLAARGEELQRAEAARLMTKDSNYAALEAMLKSKEAEYAALEAMVNAREAEQVKLLQQQLQQRAAEAETKLESTLKLIDQECATEREAALAAQASKLEAENRAATEKLLADHVRELAQVQAAKEADVLAVEAVAAAEAERKKVEVGAAQIQMATEHTATTVEALRSAEVKLSTQQQEVRAESRRAYRHVPSCSVALKYKVPRVMRAIISDAARYVLSLRALRRKIRRGMRTMRHSRLRLSRRRLSMQHWRRL
jgi:hypothetical protein